MDFKSVDDALRALEDFSSGPDIHLAAIRFLATMDECLEARGLVHALQSDDFGVRWEAAEQIVRIWRIAFPLILKALLDPKKVGDSRLREGVIHILHKITDHAFQRDVAPLLKALIGPGADVNAMYEADLLLNNNYPDSCA